MLNFKIFFQGKYLENSKYTMRKKMKAADERISVS
jgi:hypothetical protein